MFKSLADIKLGSLPAAVMIIPITIGMSSCVWLYGWRRMPDIEMPDDTLTVLLDNPV